MPDWSGKFYWRRRVCKKGVWEMEKVQEIFLFLGVFAEHNKKDSNLWYQFSYAINEFDELCQQENHCGS
jgi:hypothetical protein